MDIIDNVSMFDTDNKVQLALHKSKSAELAIFNGGHLGIFICDTTYMFNCHRIYIFGIVYTEKNDRKGCACSMNEVEWMKLNPSLAQNAVT